MVLGLKDKIEAIIEDKTNYAKSMPKRHSMMNTRFLVDRKFRQLLEKQNRMWKRI